MTTPHDAPGLRESLILARQATARLVEEAQDQYRAGPGGARMLVLAGAAAATILWALALDLTSSEPQAVPGATPTAVVVYEEGPAEPISRIGIAWLPESVRRWEAEIVTAADRYLVDPDLVAIIVTFESCGDSNARSGSNALGLMQVVPRWHPEIESAPGAFDPEHNLEVGTAFLAELLRNNAVPNDPDWRQTVEAAAYAYNSGGLVTAEGARYRRWVGGAWTERKDQTSPTFEAWSAAGGHKLCEAAL